PRATTGSHGKNFRKALSTGTPAARSLRVGVRLLNRRSSGSNECHGNAFQRTNSVGLIPSLSSELHTIVAVGSEKPSRHISCLLVRHATMSEKNCFAPMPTFLFLPSKMRSEVIGIPVKCQPR